MTQEHRPDAISDELDRVLNHIDQRFDEHGKRIDELTIQVAATNGSVRALQQWRSFMDGVRTGAGGTGRLVVVVIGVSGTMVGIAGTLFAILNSVG
jgi:hypothetical protein